MSYVIRIVGCCDPSHTEYDGKYVAEYDPTVHRPSGEYDGGLLRLTDNPSEALRFEYPGDAMEKWRQPAGCDCHGIRPWDGEPNRPLTAWHVEIFRA